ncbi:sensor histidine kinase [Polaribacter porphyrae]|uniref:Signal transduction histidine kinase internal region domain-containing protein n=1 Tax=Polaribacter porphyrae TaxID=1137780 RepID=A0A2S7WKP3_9FLAO|nr:histidine kinase [Polaribacter porphyrae]PQJ78177.1 hypothetical protein BTO18_02765 [Polaribacter porphyrae]
MNTKVNLLDKYEKKEPLLHIFLWSMVLFYPYLKYELVESTYQVSFFHELNALAFKIGFCYFLYYWFFPKKNKKKYVTIVIIVLMLNAILYEFADSFFHENSHGHFWKHFISNIVTYSSFGILFFAIFSVKNLYKKQIKIDALSIEKKQAEIKFLKSQVNPHFLFNTLNTIYANALKKDDKTPDLILKLSDGFRYILHEGQQEYVSIKQEVQHLKDYINLQQERLSKKVVLNFSVDIDDDYQSIPPLLCIAFVENAFKYTSILKGNKHHIDIKIKLINKQFYFECKNPFDKNITQDIDPYWKESGVGITNTSKRLQLLFPKTHQLVLDKKNNNFKVVLKIQL